MTPHFEIFVGMFAYVFAPPAILASLFNAPSPETYLICYVAWIVLNALFLGMAWVMSL